jgi:hypothetical protein
MADDKPSPKPEKPALDLGAWANDLLRALGADSPPKKPPPVPQLTSDLSRETIVTTTTIRPFTPEAPKPQPTPEKPKSDFWTHADKAVFGLCELLALLFGLPFGDDLYHDKPLSSIGGWHWFYLGIAVMFALTGPMWPWLRSRPRAPQTAVTALSRMAINPYAWLAALLALFFYGTGPELYQRATAPFSTPTAPREPTAQQPGPPAKPLFPPGSDLSLLTGQQIVDKIHDLERQASETKGALEDAQRQVAELQKQKSIPAPPPSGGPITWQNRLILGAASPSGVRYLIMAGTVVGSTQLKDAYIVSDFTGEKRSFLISTRAHNLDAERLPLDQINPLPPGTDIWLIIEWTPALSALEFFNQWGKLHLTIHYGDNTYNHFADEDEIKSDLVGDIPGADLVLGIPRVTKKSPQ